MLSRVSKIVCLCLILCCPILASAQEDDEDIVLRAGTVQRLTRVRRKPAANQRAFSLLQPDTKVRLISPEPRNGFFRVILPKGRQGYVRTQDVRLEQQFIPESNVLLAASTSGPCHPTLDECEDIGCARSGTAQATFNEAKRRVPTGTASRLLTFTDFRSLQGQTDEIVDQATPIEDRGVLRGLTVSSGTVREGSLVKIVGFIAQGLAPHPNTGESVNCRLTEPENNDFHIPLALRQAQTEFQGIVVEMIPQNRPAGWTIDKLLKIKEDGNLVMVVGALFYDNFHVVNDNPSDPVPRQPRRFSLWEVHPITRFFVCERANNACNPNNLNQWTKLEDFQ